MSETSVEAAKQNMSQVANFPVWVPFLSALQIAAKTRDILLYQKNNVTRELGMPPACEVFAIGKNIKNKLKKYRPKSVRSVAHLASIMRLQKNRNTMVEKHGNRNKNATFTSINEIYCKWVREQNISPVQKRIIDQIEERDFRLMATLGVSYLAIKPQIGHHFVLTYEYIAVTVEIEGANFTDEWVYMLDEVHIKEYFDYKDGSISCMSYDTETSASNTQVFMVKHNVSQYKDVVHVLPVHSISGNILHEFIKKVIMA
ncbi:Nucleoprotein [Araneus ventricosus]|uniref:Nucleoprotein n=1 Tax=Araneus ventricosus TaxID=182803 RepID=A0A4Y2PTU0_ARAVE|nr:Nucleoprotein [Araneus ventricosus]